MEFLIPHHLPRVTLEFRVPSSPQPSLMHRQPGRDRVAAPSGMGIGVGVLRSPASTYPVDFLPRHLLRAAGKLKPPRATGNTFPARHPQCKDTVQSPEVIEWADSAPPRRTAAALYKPSIWDDDFIQCLSSNWMEDEDMARMEKLKQQMRGLLGGKTLGLAKQLELVDVLQRLGVGQHLKEEIHSISLGAVRPAAGDLGEVLKGDLSSVALLFRLLRQHGYRVSQDVFDSFRGAHGGFEACLRDDVREALRLYEASQHAYKNESTLGAARAAALERLKEAVQAVDPVLKEEVAHTLELPLDRRTAQLETRWFIDLYVTKPSMNLALLELAVLNFNMVQSIYRGDLKKLSSWWWHLGLTEQLSFVRDRIMENFFVSIGTIPEPQFSLCREKFTQVSSLMNTAHIKNSNYSPMQWRGLHKIPFTHRYIGYKKDG